MNLKQTLLKHSLVGISAAGILFLSSTMAYAAGGVSGQVKDSGGNPDPNAKVTITCNGHVRHDNSLTAAGHYSVSFGALCPDGKTVDVTATDPGTGETGSNTGTMGESSVVINVKLNGVSVPEFGATTGMIAILGAAGAYFLFKKKAFHS